MSKVWAAALVLASGVGSAMAQVYVEGAVGPTSTPVPCSQFQNLGAELNCDRSDISLKAIVGYALTPWLAVEGGWIDFGRGQVSPKDVDIDAGLRVRDRTAYLGTRWTVPLTEVSPQLSGVLRAGMGQVRTEAKGWVDDGVSRFEIGGHTRKLQPLFGLGLQWALDERLSLVAAGDVTWMAAEAKKGEQLRMLSLGLNYALDGRTRTAEATASAAARPVNYMMLQVGMADSEALNPYRQDAAGRYTVSNRPAAMRWSVGRQFGPIWAMELGLTHYGEETAATKPGVTPASSGKVAPVGLSALSVWRLPTAGGLVWATRLGLSYNHTTAYDSSAGKDAATKLAPMLGLGLEYVIDKRWRVMATADATRIRVMSDDPMVKFISLGVASRF